jgi:hypothetical protein
VKVPAFVVYAEPFVVVFHHLAYVFDILKFFAYPTLYLDYLKKDKKDGWRLWISKVVFHHLAYVFDILKFFAYPTLYLDYLKKDKKDGWRLWISKYGPLLGVCRDTPILYSCIIWIICSFYVESWAGCGQCCCTENFRRETKTRKKGLVNDYIDKP